MNRDKFAIFSVAIALALAFALGPGLREAAAAGLGTTVVCEGTISGSTDESVLPNGHFVSIGNSSAVINKDCVQSSSTVTEVVDGSCGSNPCVINATTQGEIPLIANSTKCPGIGLGTALTIIMSGPLAGCQQLFTIAPFTKGTGAFLMSVAPAADASGKICKVAGAGGTGTCIAYPR